MSTKTSRSGRGGAGSTPAGKKSGKKGKPVAPVKVGKDRNWGPIALFTLVGLVAAGLIGWATFAVVNQDTRGWEDQAADIEGIVNFRDTQPDILTRDHQSGPQEYQVLPPVGGDHNGQWQNCNGTVYEDQVASEHAVHSLEHGAVWIAYDPALPQDQVDQLADRVNGSDYAMLSPFEGLDAPISLQAWGYQLKVDDAGDGRIDEFLRTLRRNASIEPGATCGGGITTATGVPVG